MHIVLKCKNLICALTLGSFLILFTTPLCTHLYFISLGVFLCVNDIEGTRMPCSCILYSNANYNFVHKTWGVSSYHLEHSPFDLIAISIFHLAFSFCQLVLWIF